MSVLGLVLVSLVNGGLVGAPIGYAPAPLPLGVAPAPVVPVAKTEIDPLPQYTYGYNVRDSLTGDYKSQVETRNGEVVKGSYSLIEADGSRRIVDYIADPINGFNAVVRKEPLVIPAAVKVAAPIAPIGPVAKIAPAAPLQFATHIL